MAAQPTPQTTPSTISDASDRQHGVEANIRTLLDVPWEQCPWPAVRNRLLAIALAGADLYAYRPAFHKAFVIWHRQSDPSVDARFSPRAWAIANGYLSAETADGQEGGA